MDKKNRNLTKVLRLLTTMKFGMILLLIIAILSILGTVIPQEYSLQYYETNYSPLIYELIMTFSLYNVFSSWWFISLIAALSINLIFCSITRIKSVFKKAFIKSNLEDEYKRINKWRDIQAEDQKVDDIYLSLGFNNCKQEDIETGTIYYSEKNQIGYLGSWLTHLGLLIIILFFTYGKIKGFDLYVYGVPGTTLEVDNTDLSIHIDDFEIEYRDDLSVRQYISDITILKAGQVEESGQVSVNHPMRTNKLNIYQNSTGWAVNAKLFKNGEEYASQVLYEDSFFVEDDQKIALQFTNFFPDFDGSSNQLRSISPHPNHPVMLYSLFYNGYREDMNLIHMGESIEHLEYSFTIDDPMRYTMFQIAHDPGKIGAFIGGLTLVMGIFLAVFLNPKKLIIYKDHNGPLRIYGYSHKSNILFQEEIELKIGDQ